MTHDSVHATPTNVPVAIELGRTRLSATNARQLELGALVPLDPHVEQPLDVYAQGHLVARGEIVVVDRKFGIRVTEIISHVNTVA